MFDLLLTARRVVAAVENSPELRRDLVCLACGDPFRPHPDENGEIGDENYLVCHNCFTSMREKQEAEEAARNAPTMATPAPPPGGGFLVPPPGWAWTANGWVQISDPRAPGIAPNYQDAEIGKAPIYQPRAGSTAPQPLSPPPATPATNAAPVRQQGPPFADNPQRRFSDAPVADAPVAGTDEGNEQRTVGTPETEGLEGPADEEHGDTPMGEYYPEEG